jgi:hypothetical protein
MYSEWNKKLRQEEERAGKSRTGTNLYSYLVILAYWKKYIACQMTIYIRCFQPGSFPYYHEG